MTSIIERTAEVKQIMVALVGYDAPFDIDDMTSLSIWKSSDSGIIRSICEIQCVRLPNNQAAFPA